MKESRQIDFSLTDLRAVKDGDKIKAVGYAAVYDSESLPINGGFVEIVKRSAFNTSLKGGEDIFAYVEHDNTKILGRRSTGTLRLVDDRRGLHIECDLPPTSYGKDLAVSIDRGDIRGMSFSFTTVKDSWESRGGRDIRSLLDVILHEVTFTANPYYTDTTVALRSRTEFFTSLAQAQRRLRLASV